MLPGTETGKAEGRACGRVRVRRGVRRERRGWGGVVAVGRAPITQELGFYRRLGTGHDRVPCITLKGPRNRYNTGSPTRPQNRAQQTPSSWRQSDCASRPEAF